MHHYNIVLDSTLAIVESAEVIVVSTNSVVEYEAESEVLERIMTADKTHTIIEAVGRRITKARGAVYSTDTVGVSVEGSVAPPGSLFDVLRFYITVDRKT